MSSWDEIELLAAKYAEQRRMKVREKQRKWRAANPERAKENSRRYKRKWKKANPEQMKVIQRRTNLRFNYNITLEDWNRLHTAQGGGCALNKDHSLGKKGLTVDHCHTTGKVRGLLCERCNLMLGHAKDDIETLRSAIRYLGG